MKNIKLQVSALNLFVSLSHLHCGDADGGGWKNNTGLYIHVLSFSLVSGLIKK